MNYDDEDFTNLHFVRFNLLLKDFYLEITKILSKIYGSCRVKIL